MSRKYSEILAINEKKTGKIKKKATSFLEH